MNLLPEYNEILYHAKVCSELEFREYWNEVQSRISVEVTDEYVNDEFEQAVKRGGGDYAKAYIEGLCDGLRDRLTQPQSDAIAFAEWIGKNWYKRIRTTGDWKRPLSPRITSEQLYELFKASK